MNRLQDESLPAVQRALQETFGDQVTPPPSAVCLPSPPSLVLFGLETLPLSLLPAPHPPPPKKEQNNSLQISVEVDMDSFLKSSHSVAALKHLQSPDGMMRIVKVRTKRGETRPCRLLV